jgi:hypothetical protein
VDEEKKATEVAPPLEPEAVLDQLFLAAKSKDEFEYVCALIRIPPGVQDPGWDRLDETVTLYRQIMSLARAPLRDDTRLRLGLLVYCHLVEADPVYEIIENMLRVIEGKRCSVKPLHDLYRRRKDRVDPPSAKTVVRHLCAHAREVGQEDTAKLLEWMFHDGIRNAFFHSDYIIHKDELRTREAALSKDDRWSRSMKIDAVIEVMNRGFHFYDAFMQKWREHRLSYKESKVVQGRLRADGGLLPIRLIVDPQHGVQGFTSPP